MAADKRKYSLPRRVMPGRKLPNNTERAVESRTFELQRQREWTEHLRFHLADDAADGSGARGLHLDKLSEDDIQAHGLSFDVGGEPRFGVFMDGDTAGGGWADVGLWDDSAGGYALRVSPEEVASGGTATKFFFAADATTPRGFTGFVTMRSPAAAMRALVLQGHASQSASIQEWQTSAGSVLGQFEPDGDLSIIGRFTATGSAAVPSDFVADDTGSTARAFPLVVTHRNTAGAGGVNMGAGLFFRVESTTEGSLNSVGSIGADATTNAFGTATGRFFLRAAVAGMNTDIAYFSGANVEFASPAIGLGSNAFRWGVSAPSPGSDADYTLTAAEYSRPIVVLQTGSWSTARNIIVPAASGSFWIFHNNGSFDATVKTAAGTGITVAASRVALLRTNGTDVLRVTADSVA